MEEKMIKYDEKQLVILFSGSSAPPPFFSNWNFVPSEIKNLLDFPQGSFSSNLEKDGSPNNEYIRSRLRSLFKYDLPIDNYVKFNFIVF